MQRVYTSQHFLSPFTSFETSSSFPLLWPRKRPPFYHGPFFLEIKIKITVINNYIYFYLYNVFCSDVNLLDKSGRTPIHNAILGRHVKIMEMLLEAGADTTRLDESQDAPLQTAVRSGDENLVGVDV